MPKAKTVPGTAYPKAAMRVMMRRGAEPCRAAKASTKPIVAAMMAAAVARPTECNVARVRPAGQLASGKCAKSNTTGRAKPNAMGMRQKPLIAKTMLREA